METKPTTRNPRTENQQAQRAQLTNLVTTYQTLSSFIRGAYPSKPKNLSDYNMFIKENLGSRIKVYLNKAEAFQKACIVAPYNISEGRLQGIETVVQGDVLRTSLRVPRSFRIEDDTTVEDVSMALLRANPQMQEGDQISILHLIQHLPEKGVPHVTWKQYDFTLDIVSYSAIHSNFYSDIPKSLFRIKDGCIQTEAGIEMGGVAYVLSREVGRKVQISTQSIVLTPDNGIYKEYSSEEKKKEAAGSYVVVAKKKTVAPKKAVNTKVVIPKKEYLHGFISRSKKILSMKKIFIVLLLVFGVAMVAQNNTVGQEETYSQREVDSMMREWKISEMQKEIEAQEDKRKERIPIIETYNNYIERVESKLSHTMTLYAIVLAAIGVGATVLGIYINIRTTKSERDLKEMEKDVKEDLKETKKDIKDELIEIRKIKEKARETLDLMVIEGEERLNSIVIDGKETLDLMVIDGKERLNSMVKLEEKTTSMYNKLINNPPDNTQIEEQSKEQKEELSGYIKEIEQKKKKAEYTAKDWFLLGYDAHLQKKHEDARSYYKKANELNPNDANIYNNWGNALFDLAKLKSDPTRFEESFDKYKKAIEMKPDYAKAYNNWGLALANLAKLKSDPTRFEESFDKYKKAIEMKPDYAKAYNNWGLALANLAKLKSDPTRFEESFDKYKKAIEMKPDYAKAYNNWGNALSDLAELKSDPVFFEKSFDKYKKAIELKPDFAEAYINWGIILKQLARIENNIEKLFSCLEEYLKYCKSKITRNDIENDTDFTAIKENPRFRQLLDKYFPEEKS
ncbi:hypothetical protein EZS27_016432 [termite gut metagenome]|uniref:Uncharacterized protein n=1 Tax=termite gut metagenome TaxID=433724 RepID=A0A5J4RN64_9ZZZZ